MRALHTLIAITFGAIALSYMTSSNIRLALLAALVANVSLAAIGIEKALSQSNLGNASAEDEGPG